MEDARRFFSTEQDIDKHRHRLPHWQQGTVWCFVTWRLGDSLPAALLRQWEDEREMWLANHPLPWDEATEEVYHSRFSDQLDDWLDQGQGKCLLRHPEQAQVVADALRHWDGERYEMQDFVVMPNHVHALFRPLGEEHALADIMKSWKGFTARQINRLRGGSGSIWQQDYWDRLIRHERHFLRTVEYIRQNPEKARLREGEYVLG